MNGIHGLLNHQVFSQPLKKSEKPGELSSWCISTLLDNLCLPMAADKPPKLYRAYSVRSKIRAWTCITATLGRFRWTFAVEEVMSSHRNLASWEFFIKLTIRRVNSSISNVILFPLFLSSLFSFKSFWFLLHFLFASLPLCLFACLPFLSIHRSQEHQCHVALFNVRIAYQSLTVPRSTGGIWKAAM